MSKLIERRIIIGKMRFKLPYESLEDCKPLWEKVEFNKKKLGIAGRWYKEVDLYIEKDVTGRETEASIPKKETEPSEHDKEREDSVPEQDKETIMEERHEDATIEERHEDAIIEERHEEAEGGEVGSDDEIEDATYEGEASDDECIDSEAGLSKKSESDDDVEVVEEEIEVFKDVNYEEQIPDEDEQYPATDDSSGDEEEQAERLVKRNMSDGIFSLRQLFNTGEEFKENVIRYILKTRRNVVFDRWEKTKLGAKCNENDCGWRIYFSVENPIEKWMVKTYEDEHQCHPVGRCKLIKSPVIADIFLEDIIRDPEMSVPEIKDEMKRRYNIIISPPKSQVARRMVFDKLQAETNEQFARLRDYEAEIKRTNKNTTVEINTIRREDGEEMFSEIYICFEKLKRSWKQNCRPIIGLDGTFLKHPVQGMILTAIGRDPNNQIYPIAWAVVSAENNDNWEWSLIHDVVTELPKAEHRACARHIYANLKKLHKSDTLKPLFWRVASSYNEGDFKASLKTFREFDPQACDDLLKKDHRTWCIAFFRTGCCCADTHNNLTESFNRTLKAARKKPFVQMLELIRRDVMQRISNRYLIACKEIGRHTKKARKEIEKSCDEAQHCYSVSSTGGKYEIVEGTNGYSVHLNRRTCVCRKWDLTGIPCRHAVCAIRENTGLVEDYISDYYLTDKWKETYRRGLKPVNGPKFWEETGGGRIFAPPYKRPPGRPKGKARIKGVHESPSKKKVGRQGREGHCSLCGGKGHNSRKCPHESQEDRAKRRRINEEAQLEGEVQAQLQAQEEANDEAQEEAEMEADFMAQLGGDEAHEEAEVQDVSSNAPQPTQVLRRSSRLASLLFG
ncbi:PREDICTED: uncharacterized protein LOC106303068 [Brassica oleracea var. oleracea]|uniref:uncharacterized protein LOC106303068 n=1 Tax=Brassica oleracea var. oleracea TaxID=109376 RepID=UPI0006A6AF87|nr:PREDICTED: uncharacterized protein LOC106303068 [Brassica oleracea var. oleracea]